ncbi:uncharacterized protein TNCT_53051 [Trichonephila clavata]|uniref:Uncharacterized protein n=1 Tax=Trichonephila clavata TaxID=2740835 RepID=A0A8X6HX32_TRICU|nr:uncharacterized protein TNCT_53051 [Trichonephila clavata]
MNGIIYLGVSLLIFKTSFVSCQVGAPYDFGISTKGEREGELSPAAIAGVCFAVIAVIAGFMVTILFCYYVHRKQKQQEQLSNSFITTRSRY